jgi:hypothetical protein
MGISTFPPPSTGGGVSFYVERFTASGTWTAPAGLTAAEVLVVGAGGGGGGGIYTGDSTSYSVSGGGAGGGLIEQVVPVTGGSAYTITVGAGGAGGVSGVDPGSAPGAGYTGNASSFGTLITVLGGGGATSQGGNQRWSLADSGLLAASFAGDYLSSASATATAGAGGGGGGIGFPFVVAATSGALFESGFFGAGGKPNANNALSDNHYGVGGVNGFGGGGGGALIETNNTRQGKGAPNAGDGLVITAGTANPAASAGVANFGGGGGGGGNNGTFVHSGANGGSGYVEIRYWA